MKTEPQAEPLLSGFAQIAFVVLMLGLMALFIMLGTWQVQRLGEKEALIANVEARIDDPAITFPEPALWPELDPEELDFRRYAVTGTFDHSQTVLIFTNLPDPVGAYGGVGYWVMAPFHLAEGGLIWVNRGFVPDTLAADFAEGGEVTEGEMTIEGVVRRPEQAGTFTPDPDFAARREWVQNPQRLTEFLSGDPGAVAPVSLDLAAGPAGTLPQGGETQIDFSNRHLEYAGTWYLFAAITPIMLGFWLWRQRQSRNLAHKGKAH